MNKTLSKLKLQEAEEEVTSVEPGGLFRFPLEVSGVRLSMTWVSKQQGVVGDLDMTALLFDERARYTERVDSSNRESKDSSLLLTKEYDPNEPLRSLGDALKLDFRAVKSSVSAVVLYLDGGPRNFQFLQSVTINCTRIKQEKTYNSFLPRDNSRGAKSGPLFSMTGKARKTYKGLVVCVFYKDGWNEEEQSALWVARSFMEPVFVSSLKEKQDLCTQLVINTVPALEKFRPRLFASVREICAALSSHALPKLKKKFQKTAEGLPIGQFTDVIFKQLFETFPKIADESEAAYTVAMLQEMFHQIDFNGDGACNWDEFTSFCVQTGLSSTSKRDTISHTSGNNNNSADFSLEQYVIEYGEEVLQRDHLLSPYRFVSVMRHVPEIHKLLIISEDSDYVLITDEKFRMHSQMFPAKVQVIGATKSKAEREAEQTRKTAGTIRTPNTVRAMIYDVLYLQGRDLYAYASSDHSITICRELSSMEGMKVNYIQHNRFYHTLLHLKLCWSAKHEILCSVASDRVIYGWNIDTSQILFQIARHSDIVTDFIAADHLDIFLTCSMDKRIVMWSATSRRVKGVLLGHKRGVRSLSIYEHTLLSAGFECEANVWDLATKDCVAVLKGHRHPIVAAKLMCDRAQSEKEHRAITVDESGEFRLWNIYVRERASNPVPVPTMQIFEMQNGEHPLNQFRFLALPYNPKSSTSYYSDLIACSTKLMHFLPEKNMKEFVPPTACTANEASALLVTAVGKSVLCYDLTYGEFANVFENITANEVKAICMDGERGRRMYLGTSHGEILLINTMTGQLIDHVCFHTGEIRAIVQRSDLRSTVYSVAMDGGVRMYDESGGKIHLQNSSDCLFGASAGISILKHVPTLHILLVAAEAKEDTDTKDKNNNNHNNNHNSHKEENKESGSAPACWAILHDTTLKKLAVVHEEEYVTAMAVIGASGDKEEEQLVHKAHIAEVLSSGNHKNKNSNNAGTSAIATVSKSLYEAPPAKESLLTVAVALARKVCVYTLDVHDLKGVKTFELVQDQLGLCITGLTVIRAPDIKTVNYAFLRAANNSNVNTGANAGSIAHSSSTGGGGGRAVSGEGGLLVASSDDGKLLVWDTEDADSLRIHCEAKYRAHFRFWASQQKKSAKGRRAEREKEKDGATQAELQKREIQAQLERAQTEQKQKEKEKREQEKQRVAKEEAERAAQREREKHEDNAFLTDEKSPNKKGSNGRKGSVVRPSSAGSVQSAASSSTISQIQAMANQSQHSQKANTGGEISIKTWVELPSSDFFPVALSGKARKAANTNDLSVLLMTNLSPCRMWTAHNDAVSFLVPLETHSCFVTASYDGYHRVWNLDAECLGELVLPNITEAMKRHAMCTETGTQWRFILERIPITKHHIEIANVIVKQLKQSRQERMQDQQLSDRRNHVLNVSAGALKDLVANSNSMNNSFLSDSESPARSRAHSHSVSPTHTRSPSTQLARERERQQQEREREMLRTQVLRSLNEAPLPPEDVPPTRLPTKEEKELIRLSLITNNQFSLSLSSDSLDNTNPITNAMPPESSLTENSLTLLSASHQREKEFSQSLSLSAGPSRALSRQSVRSQPQKNAGRVLSPLRITSPNASSPRKSAPLSSDIPRQQLQSSVVFGGDSGVCMSCFGGPSLWTVPGERDIFGHSVSFSSSSNPPDMGLAPAFSEQSVNSLQREGLIDMEGRAILRRIGMNPDRVEVYDRSQPTLLVRNPSLSTSIQLPQLENVSKTEISFGLQKEMYKNAERYLNEKSNISKSSVRNAVTLTRIEQNVRRVQSMIHLIQPPSHDEVILPKHSGESDGPGAKSDLATRQRHEEQKMRIRLLKSAALVPEEAKERVRPLDRHSLERWSAKLKTAMEGAQDGRKNAQHGSDGHGRNKKKKETVSQAMLISLEHKLQQAIRGEYRARMQALQAKNSAVKISTGDDASESTVQEPQRLTISVNDDHKEREEDLVSLDSSEASMHSSHDPTKKTFTLTTRQLLPYYKLETVHQFMDIFAKVDENFSGDLDVNEWIKLFSSLNESVTDQEARMIFLKIDKDNDGFLSMRELIPVVFSKASKEQMRLIIQYAEMELTKKVEHEQAPKVTSTDLEFLFEAYDTENLGFVDISYVKARIRRMRLTEQALFFFMEMIADLADDDMVNLVEFKRIFKPFTRKKNSS